ncbi:Zinc finger BED domain-containing protein RICESLEEPER 2 [Linum perenne]
MNSSSQQEGNQNPTSEQVQPTRKRKKTAIVWGDFKEVVDKVDNIKKLECIHCKTKMTMSSSGTTTHLNRHSIGCPRKPKNLADKNQQQLNIVATINNAESVNAVENFRYDQLKLKQMIAHWIIVTEKPLSTVEHDLFTMMMKTANPLYQRISRTSITSDVFSTYELFKGKVKDALKNVQRMSLTTDMWQSNQTTGYMVVTCHFVDKNWKLQKRVLNFCHVPPPHSGTNVSDALHKCLVDWDIENKIWTITLDNAAYNDLAMRTLKNTLTFVSKLPLSGEIFHVRCCAHILNLLVQCGLKEIEGIIENVRQSVKHIAMSEQRVNWFREIAKQLRLSGKKLTLDCCTRWNSTYFMLSGASEFKAVFPQYALRDSNYKWLPSEEDWLKVSNVCQFLELFSDVTNIISGSSYTTANVFLPELWRIKVLLKNTIQSDDESMKAMAIKMQQKFDKYWGDSNLVLAFAVVLDPRNKMRVIEVVFPDLYSEDTYLRHVHLVREKLYKLFEEYVEEYKARDIANPSGRVAETVAATISESGKDKKLTGQDLLGSMVRNVTSSSSTTMKSELDICLEAALEERTTNFNVIDWWRNNRSSYKILSRMATEIMAIPITSVASEAAFSAGGRVIDPSRAFLGKKTVEALLCSQDWLKNHYGVTRSSKVSFSFLL